MKTMKKIQIVLIAFLVLLAIGNSTQGNIGLGPICGVLSFFLAYLIHVFIKNKLWSYVSIIIGSPILGLAISVMDPPNSFAIFIFSTIFNLIFTTFFYYVNFHKKIEENNKNE
jgi:hypothetical protein